MTENMVIAIVFEETDVIERLAEIIDRAKKIATDIPDVQVQFTRGDAAETIRFFVEKGELPTDAEESNLVTHARRELALAGNDDAFNNCIIKAVKGFAGYGHSGGSASVGIQILHDLLQFKNLTPLTDDPNEWMKISEVDWQSKRDHEAFSRDGGKTYYLLSEGAHFGNPQPLHESQHKEN